MMASVALNFERPAFQTMFEDISKKAKSTALLRQRPELISVESISIQVCIESVIYQ